MTRMITSPGSELLRTLAALIAGRISVEALSPPSHGSETAGYWAELARAATAHGLGPLLLWRVQQAGTRPVPAGAGLGWDWTGTGDSDLLATLAEERNRAAVHFMLADVAQAQVQAAMDAAGIECVWLKGIVLARTVYPAPELRPMVDVDLLVPYAQREQALVVMQSLGYVQELPLLFDGTEDLKHHYHLASKTLRPLKLELHFRLLGAFDRILTVEQLGWFWHHTIDMDRAGSACRALGPEAHLLYLCGHALLQHGEADLRLLRFYDLHCLVSQTPDLDWDLVVDGAARLRWTYAAERALTLAREYFGTPLPEDLPAWLAANRPPQEKVTHVTRRQMARTTSEIVAHDLAAMGWQDRTRTLARIVAPPPSYMRQRYRLDNDRQLPAAYLRRWSRMAANAVSTVRRKAQGSS